MKTPYFRQAPYLLMAIAISVAMSVPAWAVTPFENEIQKILASDGALDDQFGLSVALDGDTALIGAIGDDDHGNYSGSAYVFRRVGSAWIEEAKLTASDGAAYDQFGSAVALDGDTAVVGAYTEDENGRRSGSAYVYRRDVDTWVEEAKLTASDGTAHDQFGYSVALDGDTAVIGTGHDYLRNYSGSAYVFYRDGSTWIQQAKLTPSAGSADDQFGRSVALDGDTTVVGARGDDENGDTSGSAYVFRWDGSTWIQQAKLTASDGAAYDQFGTAVALDGDTAVIGAIGDDDNGLFFGSAYVFRRDGSVWDEEDKLTASDASPDDLFGRAVALDGDTAVIGSGGSGYNEIPGSGYIFRHDGYSWSETIKLQASDGMGSDRFGLFLGGVDINAGNVLAGAAYEDAIAPNAGAAYLFSLNTDGQVDAQSPLVGNVLVDPNPVAFDTSFTIMAIVDDGTTGDSDIAGATYTIDGSPAVAMEAIDGTFDEATEDVMATVAAGREAGFYTVCVTGSDTAGNVSNEECTMLTVHDRNTGFVTGGGWIYSEAGSHALDESIEGKASFNFVAKNKKGGRVSAEYTKFRFRIAGMNFQSDDCRWLIVAGSWAQCKGTGTINGAGNYGVLITLMDQASTTHTDIDRIRIKIWHVASGSIVYDNQRGAGNDADPTMAIGGGSIVIHSSEGK